MAINDNIVAELATIPTDSGGQYVVRVVLGENGREAVLLAYERENGPPRFLILRGFAVRPIINALLAFMERGEKGLEPKYQAIKNRLGAGEPAKPAAPEPPRMVPIPEAEQKALPWHGRRGSK